MSPKAVNPASPARILDRSTRGGPGPGRIGVVVARAGAGKAAFLAHLALDAILDGQDVLHIVLNEPLDHAEARYDALLAAFPGASPDAGERRALVSRRRAIQSYPEAGFEPAKLERSLRLFAEHAGLRPSLVVIEGLRWAEAPEARAAALTALAAAAGTARVWISAEAREAPAEHEPVPSPCREVLDQLDVAVLLETAGTAVTARLVHEAGAAPAAGAAVLLDPDTLLLQGASARDPRPALPGAHTLLSGAANGAEAEFGACAEAWGLQEINFSFAGRSTARSRGVVELSDAELHQGEVSTAYLEAQLHRKFPNTPMFRKMLQTIWHQVTTAGEVFVVGLILPDNTVNGGTGWAAELARHFDKPVHVYDQERHGWFTWAGQEWQAEARPRITRPRFAGTGTRFLSEDGRVAIRALFEDSFGPPPSR